MASNTIFSRGQLCARLTHQPRNKRFSFRLNLILSNDNGSENVKTLNAWGPEKVQHIVTTSLSLQSSEKVLMELKISGKTTQSIHYRRPCHLSKQH